MAKVIVEKELSFNWRHPIVRCYDCGKLTWNIDRLSKVELLNLTVIGETCKNCHETMVEQLIVTHMLLKDMI